MRASHKVVISSYSGPINLLVGLYVNAEASLNRDIVGTQRYNSSATLQPHGRVRCIVVVRNVSTIVMGYDYPYEPSSFAATA